MAHVEMTRLVLTNYRSYRSLDLALSPGLSVLHGANAAGKSNLMEAAYLLAIGKSYRALTERELVSWNAAEAGGYAMVVGNANRADGPVELMVALDCGGAQPNSVVKRVRINGLPKRAVDMVGVLSAVLFSAEDIDLITGPPQSRRRYLDVMLSQLGGRYVQTLQRYQRVLAQRNHLLRDLRDGRAGEDELPYWDQALCVEGAAVLGARHAALERLAPLGAEAYRRLAGDGELEIAYAGAVPAGDAPIAEAFEAALRSSRARERAMAMTIVGPHRDDLRLTLGGVDIARHASRGQARLAALALRIAEARLLHERRGDAPVLLLDDVLSELDDSRRAQVLEEAQRYPQAIVSTADLRTVPAGIVDRARLLRVHAGEVREGAAV